MYIKEDCNVTVTNDINSVFKIVLFFLIFSHSLVSLDCLLNTISYSLGVLEVLPE